MSQHLFNSTIDGDNVEIQMGWDTPMQWFYMVIEKDIDDSDEPLYSNLFDNNYRVGQLEYYIELLNEWNVLIPNGLLDSINNDKINSRMNNQVHWK